MPTVSVIIPNYNHARFLPKRIESVLHQTYDDIEVIILDDCSTDNSREVIERYASQDRRISTCFNEHNSGSPFRQWKKGIDLAKGQYIWIAESDDFAHAELLAKFMGAIEQNEGVDLAYCQSNFVNADDEVVGNHLQNLSVLHPTLWQSDFCMDGNELLARFMPIINVIPNAGAVLFRHNLISKVNWTKLFSFRLGGDRYFWVELLHNSRLCFVSQPLNYFRMDGETQRGKYIYTSLYLREIADNVWGICKRTRVSRKVKTLALKQWGQYYRKARKHTREGFFQFHWNTFPALAKFLGVYLK